MIAFRSTLRSTAVLIAALAWLDPACVVSARALPQLGIASLRSSAPSRHLFENIATFSSQDVGARVDAASAVRARLEAELRDTFTIVPAFVESAAANLNVNVSVNVIVADRLPERDELPPSGHLSAISLADEAAPNVLIRRIDAPARMHVRQSARLEVALRAAGMKGQSSTVVLRDGSLTAAGRGWADGSLELTRRTLKWEGEDEVRSATLTYVPTRSGPALLTVEVLPLSLERTTADNRAQVRIDVSDEPHRVLVYEPRASWASTFVRRALSADPSLAVDAVVRPSRGLSIDTAPRSAGPASPSSGVGLSFPRAFESYDAIVVGAPERLTGNEVQALESYLRIRGGRLLIAPDALPSGPIGELLPAARWSIRFAEQPERVAMEDSGGRDGGPTPDQRLQVTEWLAATELRHGVEVVARTSTSRTPVITTHAVGAGRVVLFAALDAWKHRARDGSTFDAFWRDLAGRAAAESPPAIGITMTPSVIAPGGHVQVAVALRPTELWQRAGSWDIPRVRAGLQPADESPPSARVHVRLWPGLEPGSFEGSFIAPDSGTWRLSVDHEGPGGASANASLIVDPTASRLESDITSTLSLLTAARGGVTVTADRLEPLVSHLRSLGTARSVQVTRQPFRSVWWLAPFATCLGLEWWLRRVAGLR